MYALRPFCCRHCGAVVVDNKKRRRKLQCLECAIGRQGDSVRQLIAHQGPYYDRWLAATVAGLQRLATSPAPGECPLGRR